MADNGLSDLVRQIAFYRGGGQPEGQRGIDKINKTFETVGGLGTQMNDVVKMVLENKKKSLENDKLTQESQPAGAAEGIPSFQDEQTQKQLLNQKNATRVPENIYPQPTPMQQEAPPRLLGQAVPQPEQFVGRRDEFTKRTGMDPDLSVPMNVQKSLIPLRSAQTGLATSKIGGDTINVDDVISKATGLPIGKITKVQYDATLNALKLEAKTNPTRPLRPFEALILGVPFGTTAAQAEGIIPRSQTDKEKITQFNGAIAVVDQIDKLSKHVNVYENAFDRFTQGGLAALDAYTQNDPVATQLANQGAYLAQIIRGLGEKGTLAEGDVRRGLDAIPKVYPLPDTRAVAESKIVELKQLFSTISNSYLQTLTTPIRVPAGGPQQPPPTPQQQHAAGTGGGNLLNDLINRHK